MKFTTNNTRKLLNRGGMIILLLILIYQLITNISNGYVLVAPIELDNPVIWKRFQSQLELIQIDLPASWNARDLPNGNHNDKEAIVFIRVENKSYPYVIIARKEIEEPTLDKVARWGQSRIETLVHQPNSLKNISVEKAEIKQELALIQKFEYRVLYKVNCTQVYLLKHKDAYVVKLCVDEKNDSVALQEVFEHIIYSISLTSQNS